MKKNNFKIIELKPEENKNSVKRTVFIKDFIVHEIIGIHNHEKIKKQKIKFNFLKKISFFLFPLLITNFRYFIIFLIYIFLLLEMYLR